MVSMKKITVCNQKGGAGKTTLTMLLATSLAKAGQSVGIIDLDPQGTSTDWINNLPEAEPNLSLAEEGREYDVVFYDTPPALGETLAEALQDSDIAVIVSSPSPADLWSTQKTVKFVDEHLPEDAKRCLLFNKVNAQNTFGKNLSQMGEMIGVEPLEKFIPNYTAYQKAVLMGWSALGTKEREPILHSALAIISL